jgi:SAM-dependent methyltransferase
MDEGPAGTMSDIYHDGRYLEDNPDWHEGDADWKAGNIARLLKANGLQPATLADVGCGTGGVLRGLVERKVAGSYHGFEISPQAHAIAAERGASEIAFHHQDLLTAPADVTFDVVMAIDVFEHVEDYLGFLRDLRVRGAHAVFHIPLDLSAQAIVRSSPILGNRERLGHLHYFTKDTALATLADAGYDVVDFFYTAAALERGENLSARAKLLRLPRRLMSAASPDLAARLLGGWSLMVLAR